MAIEIGEFEIILTVLFVVGSAFAAWLYRHERWFRDIVFPLVQVLTGKTPDGSDLDRTDDGHLEETANRFERVEDDVEESLKVATEALEVAKETRGEVRDLKQRQEERGNRTESILRTILSAVDVDDEDIDRPLFRGGDRERRRRGDTGDD